MRGGSQREAPREAAALLTAGKLSASQPASQPVAGPLFMIQPGMHGMVERGREGCDGLVGTR